jgi:hypothetical protein
MDLTHELYLAHLDKWKGTFSHRMLHRDLLGCDQ